MKAFKKIVVLALVAVFALGLASCSDPDAGKPVLKMVTSADFPPYEFYDKDQNFTGVDIEIIQAVADDLGMTLEIQDLPFKSVIAAVQNGNADIALSGITVTEDRKDQVNFSITYTTATQAIIVKEGSAITCAEDLEGKKVGTQLSTTGDIDVADIKDVQQESYEKSAMAIMALVNGNVDAVVIDDQPAKAFAAQNPGLVVLDEAFVVEEYAIAVNKEKTELLEQINASLQKLIDDGTVQTIIDKYIK